MKQLCYASRSTSVQPELLNDLRNILSEARDFNARHGVTGVLYFADGYFFQCLEGADSVLDVLLIKLKKDSRHQDVQIYRVKDIEQAHFLDWNMKYVSRSSKAYQLLHEQGQAKFQPFSMNSQQIDEFVSHLYTAPPDEAA